MVFRRVCRLPSCSVGLGSRGGSAGGVGGGVAPGVPGAPRWEAAATITPTTADPGMLIHSKRGLVIVHSTHGLLCRFSGPTPENLHSRPVRGPARPLCTITRFFVWCRYERNERTKPRTKDNDRRPKYAQKSGVPGIPGGPGSPWVPGVPAGSRPCSGPGCTRVGTVPGSQVCIRPGCPSKPCSLTSFLRQEVLRILF